jgi:outer membrane protein assembly factor BamB
MQWADLSAAKEWELEGRVVWGPERIADLVLVASDSEGLIGLEAGAAQRWISPLPFGPLAGSPLVVDDTVVLASVGGTLWRVSARTGQQIPWEKAEGGNQPRDQFEVNEPLAAGPVAWGRRLLLAGRDGTLYVTAMPPPAQPTVELGKAQ